MTTANERLKKARTTAGFETATEAAKRFHWAEPTYLAHENGSRGFPKGKAITYAKAFKIRLEWLLLGTGDMRADTTVRLVGYVGAGGLIMPVDDHTLGDDLSEVEAPTEAGPDTVALQVRGESQWPAYSDGDLIYYNKSDSIVSEAIGKMSVVKTSSGELMLKMVKRGTKANHYQLISINAPPMDDIVIEWAAPVRWVKKRV